MELNTNWIHYTNGNYEVYLNLDNGTMIRTSADDYLAPKFPDSMDIKITNRCDRGCKWCHEKSVPYGKEADFDRLVYFIKMLPPYTQLAIGGGNVLSYSRLEEFLDICKDQRLVPSITVNQKHFEDEFERLKCLYDLKKIYGLGISLENVTDTFLQRVSYFPNAVIHVIVGVVTEEQLRQLAYLNLKILVLGYKIFGRGEWYFDHFHKNVSHNLHGFRYIFQEMLDGKWFVNIAFDNLALKQLDIKSFLTEEQWKTFYMGDDGISTMYVDMVEGLFARSSTSNVRYPLSNNVEDMLAVIHSEKE